MTRTSSRGRSGHESRRGAGVKHLVELSKIWWNRVKHQPEPIRKASAEVAHRRVSLPPPQLPEISPAIFVTVRGSPAPLYGQEMAEMACTAGRVAPIESRTTVSSPSLQSSSEPPRASGAPKASVATDLSTLIGQIAFSGGPPGAEDVYVVNADGTGLRKLTTDPEAQFDPT
jgi:hypothetical protein